MKAKRFEEEGEEEEENEEEMEMKENIKPAKSKKSNVDSNTKHKIVVFFQHHRHPLTFMLGPIF